MIPQKVKDFLDAHGLAALEFEPGSTATAAMAAEQVGVSVGQIVKSLLFKNKEGKYFMLLVAGDKKVSGSKVKTVTGSKADMTSPNETLALTGYPIGGVCPFGVQGAEVYIDKSLAAYDAVYPAAGTTNTAVKTSYQQLLKILSAQECDVTV